jgi:hypothetical protein
MCNLYKPGFVNSDLVRNKLIINININNNKIFFENFNQYKNPLEIYQSINSIKKIPLNKRLKIINKNNINNYKSINGKINKNNHLNNLQVNNSQTIITNRISNGNICSNNSLFHNFKNNGRGRL